MELLRSLAMARGWVVANGLPDEARAARRILHDYTSGRLVWVASPPGHQHEALEGTPRGGAEGEGADVGEEASASSSAVGGEAQVEAGRGLDLTDADLDLLQDLEADAQGTCDFGCVAVVC